MRTVALDLGVRKICLCEVRDGVVVQRVTVRSLKELQPYLGADTPPAQVAFEACREAWHVHDVLRAQGHEPIMLDTTRVARIGVGQHGTKTDRRDALALALALERGNIPVAHVLSPERRTMRDELSTRAALVQARAQFVTTVRGLVRAHGHLLPSSSVEAFTRRVRAVGLAPDVLLLVEPLLRVLDDVAAQIDAVETRFENLARTAPEIALLATVPGVGLIVAATFVAALDEAGRFHDAHAVQSYLGLVPCEDSSGGRRRLGAITRQGNPWARAMLVQAAHGMLRAGPVEDPLRLWAQRVSERRGKMIAVVALARRLAGVLWAMWRRGDVYDPRRLAARSAEGLYAASDQTASHAARQAALAAAETKIYPRTRPSRVPRASRPSRVATRGEVP